MNSENRPNPTLHYQAEGSGHPVILIHGIAASLLDWVFLTPTLTTAGCQVFTVDLPGHGESEQPANVEAYSFLALFRSLEAWIEQLSLPEAPVLIGHSLGGALSLNYAAQHPEHTAGLVLIDPFYRSSQLRPHLRALNRQPDLWARMLRKTPAWFINALLGLDLATINKFPPALRRQIAHDYIRASPLILHIPQTVPDLTPLLPEIDLPSLVLWGEKDITLAPSSFVDLVRLLPQASGHSFPGEGHQPHLARPEQANPLILQFIREIYAVSSRELTV